MTEFSFKVSCKIAYQGQTQANFLRLIWALSSESGRNVSVLSGMIFSLTDGEPAALGMWDCVLSGKNISTEQGDCVQALIGLND